MQGGAVLKKLLFKIIIILACSGISIITVISLTIYTRLAQPDSAADESGKYVDTISPQADKGEQKDIREMRGIWLPYMCLTLSKNEQSETSFRRKVCGILDKCSACGLNTVIMQVRPFSDALYPSEYYPWSHILTGEQGADPGYDPLAIMVQEAHKRNIALHAWINPFRISTGSTPPELSRDNPYIKWKNNSVIDDENYYFEYENGLYFDPSSRHVRELIINGVRELAENYDIDGIQIDDYFYPAEDDSLDAESYEKYKNTLSDGSMMLSHKEWRKNNINMLICGMYTAAHSAKKDILFGIAPQCNFENDEKMSADIQSWCSLSGYVDYICPQLYVSNEHPVFPFEKLADEWCRVMKNESTLLYFGLGLYKVGTDADSGTWLTGENIIRSQINSLQKRGVNGFILYSYEFIDNFS